MHTVTHPDFCGVERYVDRRPMNVSPWLVPNFKISKFMSPDALKTHSVTLSVLRFLSKRFSKLL